MYSLVQMEGMDGVGEQEQVELEAAERPRGGLRVRNERILDSEGIRTGGSKRSADGSSSNSQKKKKAAAVRVAMETELALAEVYQDHVLLQRLSRVKALDEEERRRLKQIAGGGRTVWGTGLVNACSYTRSSTNLADRRLYCWASAQTMDKRVRCLLFSNSAWCIGTCNCGPCLVEQILARRGVHCEELSEYVRDSRDIIQRHQGRRRAAQGRRPRRTLWQ